MGKIFYITPWAQPNLTAGWYYPTVIDANCCVSNGNILREIALSAPYPSCPIPNPTVTSPTSSKGTALQTGNFVWMAAGLDYAGHSLQRKGTLLLIR